MLNNNIGSCWDCEMRQTMQNQCLVFIGKTSVQMKKKLCVCVTTKAMNCGVAHFHHHCQIDRKLFIQITWWNLTKMKRNEMKRPADGWAARNCQNAYLLICVCYKIKWLDSTTVLFVSWERTCAWQRCDKDNFWCAYNVIAALLFLFSFLLLIFLMIDVVVVAYSEPNWCTPIAIVNSITVLR